MLGTVSEQQDQCGWDRKGRGSVVGDPASEPGQGPAGSHEQFEVHSHDNGEALGESEAAEGVLSLIFS